MSPEQAARSFRGTGPVELPVDVRKLAMERAGVRILDHPMEAAHSGMLLRKNGRSIVVVNSKHHPRRQRFSIAHELGHLYLHRGEAGQEIFHRRDMHQRVDQREVDANRFAAEILMPADQVRAEAQRLNPDPWTDRRIQLLAKKFDVSVAAMTFRLQNLGELDPSDHW